MPGAVCLITLCACLAACGQARDVSPASQDTKTAPVQPGSDPTGDPARIEIQTTSNGFSDLDVGQLTAQTMSRKTAERLDAVVDLGEIDTEAATNALVGALADADPGIREEAVEALAQKPSRLALDGLTQALYDADVNVRYAAIAALGERGSDAAALALGRMFSEKNEELSLDAIDALTDMAGPVAEGLLEQALSDERETVRDAAEEALEALRSEVDA